MYEENWGGKGGSGKIPGEKVTLELSSEEQAGVGR